VSCTKINTRAFKGFVCGPDALVNLEPYGARGWLEWHSYLGPHFYRSKYSTVEIRNPSKKMWAAFEVWRKEVEA